MASSGTKNSGDLRGSTRSTSRRSDSVTRRALRRDISCLLPSRFDTHQGSALAHTVAAHDPAEGRGWTSLALLSQGKLAHLPQGHPTPQTFFVPSEFPGASVASAAALHPNWLPPVGPPQRLSGSRASSRSLFCVMRRLAFARPAPACLRRPTHARCRGPTCLLFPPSAAPFLLSPLALSSRPPLHTISRGHPRLSSGAP